MPFNVSGFGLRKFSLAALFKSRGEGGRIGMVYPYPGGGKNAKGFRAAMPGYEGLCSQPCHGFSRLDSNPLCRVQVLLVIDHFEGFTFQIVNGKLRGPAEATIQGSVEIVPWCCKRYLH
jgi:hypothetical protein